MGPSRAPSEHRISAVTIFDKLATDILKKALRFNSVNIFYSKSSKTNNVLRLFPSYYLCDNKLQPNGAYYLNPIQTGLFWSICDWVGGSSDPPSLSLEPIMLGS